MTLPDRFSPPKLVCFDLGNVWIPIAGSWADAARRCGLDPWPYAAPAVPSGQIDGLGLPKGLFDRYERGALFAAEDFFARAGEALGCPSEVVARMSQAWLLEPFPETGALLDEIRQTGWKTACLTNVNDHHWRLITDPASAFWLPLDRLDYRIASHLVGAVKPEPAIYEAVERMAGCSGSEIVFFDDLSANVEAADRRGWRACQILPGEAPAAQMARVLERCGLVWRNPPAWRAP